MNSQVCRQDQEIRCWCHRFQFWRSGAYQLRWESARIRTLTLQLFCSVVCVWNIWRDVKLLTGLVVFGFRFWFCSTNFIFNFSRGHRRPIELCPTKLSMVSLGYPGWSPGRTCIHFSTVSMSFFWNGDRPSQEPARRPIGLPIPFCTVFAIWTSMV